MTTPELGTDTPGLTVRCQENRAVSVRFRDRFSFDADSVHYAVELEAPGLTARNDEIVAWIWDRDLPSFLEELTAEFRRWDGERVWHTDDHDLTVAAVFRAGGHIGLTWTLRPWVRASGGWSASVTTVLEAGEQLSSLAADLRHFLAAEAR
ncbi:DUF6228 family protein [Streptomyces sp. NPDC006422]|uniref:DUF6228 family protein n=1 Tax=unclassified Streptomyces TaxID=2593676 RepID=UPI0033AAD5E0